MNYHSGKWAQGKQLRPYAEKFKALSSSIYVLQDGEFEGKTAGKLVNVKQQ
jgi:hypothetical protein